MDEAYTRISVDLTQFFKDYRRFCWVHIDLSRMKTINDLKFYLSCSLNIPGELELMLDDCLLLQENDLRVLRDGDHVKLIDASKYPADSTSNQEARSSVTHQLSILHNGVPNTETNEPETGTASSTHKKRKKREEVSPSIYQENASTSNGISLKTSSSEKNLIVKEKDKKQTKQTTLPHNGLSHLDENKEKVVQESSTQEEAEDWTSFPLPKRKRTRKHKKKKTVQENAVAVSEPLVNIAATPVTPPVVRPQCIHIRFDAMGPEVKEEQPCTSRTAAQEISRNHAALTTTASSSETLLEKGAGSSAQATHEKSQPKPDFSALLSRKTPIIVERKPIITVDISSESYEKTSKVPHYYWESLTDTHLWNSTIVNSAPSLNDTLAFKVLCLGADYTPQLSGWIIGRVTIESNEEGKHTLEILRGVNPFIRDGEGKFDVKDMVEQQSEKVLVIPWEDMMVLRKLDVPSDSADS